MYHYKILVHHEKINQILKGEMPMPIMVALHPVYGCNHNCIGCEFSHHNRLFKTWTEENTNKILNEIVNSGAKGIEISGGGEPLLLPNLKDIITRLRKKGMTIQILTNGSLLKGQIAETIVKNCDYLRVSLESGSPEIFEKVKRVDGNEFKNIVKNIKEVVKLRNTLKKNIFVAVKFTVNRYNHRDMENAIKIGIRLKVDNIQFKCYRNVPKEFHAPQTAQKRLSNLKRIYGKRLRIVGDLKKSYTKHKCFLTPLLAIIDPYADVYMCTYYGHRTNTHKIGNLLKNSFDEIWHSKNHFNKIKNIRMEECNIYDCRFFAYLEVINKFLENKYLQHFL